MRFDELNALRRAHVKANGPSATDAIIRLFGGADEGGTVALGNIDPSDFDALATELSKGTGSPRSTCRAVGKAAPKSLAELYEPAFKKFNTGWKKAD